MLLKITPHCRPNTNPDTVVVYPRPFGGNEHNTDDRLKYWAEKTGFLVLGVQAPGTGRVLPGAGGLRAAWRASFPGLTLDCAAELAETITDYPTRVGFGDSGRTILVAGMANSWAERHPDESPLFTHVLGRDGVNLRAPEPRAVGRRRLMHQNQRSLREEHKINLNADGREVPLGLHPDIADRMATFESKRPPAPNSRVHQARKIAEMLLFNTLMCSTASREAVEGLAGNTAVALRYVGLSSGISGTQGQASRFNTALYERRCSSAAGHPAAAIYASLEIGRHTDLLHPHLALTHLLETTRLETLA